MIFFFFKFSLVCLLYDIHVSFQVVEQDIYKFLMSDVKCRASIGLVGGSDLQKMAEQMGGDQCKHHIFSANTFQKLGFFTVF